MGLKNVYHSYEQAPQSHLNDEYEHYPLPVHCEGLGMVSKQEASMHKHMQD